ncbi:SDR family NAD(P)-dependent oxidoreductase [Rhabdothermincola salaria]|uniref:SDR family NAD(P)-dependent oxidoreductase n=1 Tax=Rhabdothermincola salaria TaxID=2903142 RepID=UPI001E29F042|nr:SDR family NAD(P)-dependent oxidoreductase [Rhabdothermincola salaria]MCD9624010.1 SDR family NAD(P)-dependent oxidoreductase [Rhabdothermincola salaria]
MDQLEGRVAVVTGAGSGMGQAMAQRFAGEGMRVVAADIEQPALDATVAALADGGATAIGVRTDVSSASDVEMLAETAYTEFGGVHLVCANAGVFTGGLVWERTVADFEWTMGVNYFGIVHAIRSFVPRMLAGGEPGHVVTTASMGGLVTNAYSGPYYGSKFAAVGLTECLAHDLASVGAPIGVSCLVPSLVATGIGTSGRNRPERFVDRLRPDPTPDAEFVDAAIRDSTASGMAPDEVADLVLDAVRADRFWIPTKPSYHDQIRGRHDDMQALRLPASPTLD